MGKGKVGVGKVEQGCRRRGRGGMWREGVKGGGRGCRWKESRAGGVKVRVEKREESWKAG
jgi:hypothetical protein